MSQDQVYLVVTSAFTLGGSIAMPGELVQVTDSEARNYLGRGMARPATELDGVPNTPTNGDDEQPEDGEGESQEDASTEATPDGDAPPAVAAKPAKPKK